MLIENVLLPSCFNRHLQAFVDDYVGQQLLIKLRSEKAVQRLDKYELADGRKLADGRTCN